MPDIICYLHNGKDQIRCVFNGGISITTESMKNNPWSNNRKLVFPSFLKLTVTFTVPFSAACKRFLESQDIKYIFALNDTSFLTSLSFVERKAILEPFSESKSLVYFPNSSLASCQAIWTLDMLGFRYCHTVYQDSFQIKLKIQMKLKIK